MNRTVIDWPGLDYTWNPITGCKRGCTYCYARRMHERFNKTPFSEIVVHKERLSQPIKEKNSSTIFVGSMSDIEYWRPIDTEKIIDICKECPQHTFMFLSKNPTSYFGFDWPKNTMQGLTLTLSQTEHCQKECLEEMKKYPSPFLSIEPIGGYLKAKISGFERVIVGAMTGPGAYAPDIEWLRSIRENVPNEIIHWKQNIMEAL